MNNPINNIDIKKNISYWINIELASVARKHKDNHHQLNLLKNILAKIQFQ